MTDLSITSTEFAELSVSQLAALPPARLAEADHHLDQVQAQLKQVRTRLGAALERRYGEMARAALRDSGRDFGTAHVSDGPLRIKFEQPKKVSWDQKQLSEIAQRIVASGEPIESYLDVKLSVPESKYTNWPPVLQQQFAGARTVEPGKAAFTLAFDWTDA